MHVYRNAIIFAVIAVIFSFIIFYFNLEDSQDLDAMEIFFGVFGTMYAIIVGFVILMIADHYHEIRQNIAGELNSLQNLHDYLIYLDDSHRETIGHITAALHTYLQSIIKKEWPVMVSKQHSHIYTSPELYDLMKAIDKIQPKNEKDLIGFENLIEEVNEVTTYRTNRLSMSNEKPPSILIHIVLILSIIVIVIFTFIPLNFLVLKLILDGALAFSVTLIYNMILDLNNPFWGDWNITVEDYVTLAEKI